MTLAENTKDVVSVPTVPVSRLEPAPLNVGVEDLRERLEISALPRSEALPGDALGVGAFGHEDRIERSGGQPTESAPSSWSS